jgi:hypothetical protein
VAVAGERRFRPGFAVLPGQFTAGIYVASCRRW